jgi:hypothetical protein
LPASRAPASPGPVTGGVREAPVDVVVPGVSCRPPPGRPARGSYGVDAAFMQLQRHGSGIHAVSVTLAGCGRRNGGAGGTEGGAGQDTWAGYLGGDAGRGRRGRDAGELGEDAGAGTPGRWAGTAGPRPELADGRLHQAATIAGEDR